MGGKFFRYLRAKRACRDIGCGANHRITNGALPKHRRDNQPKSRLKWLRLVNSLPFRQSLQSFRNQGTGQGFSVTNEGVE
jgi:hypothetical protein